MSSDSDPSHWSVHRLKEELDKHKISYAGCSEKAEFIELLQKIPGYQEVHVEHAREPPAHVSGVDTSVPHFFDEKTDKQHAEHVKQQQQTPPPQEARPPPNPASPRDPNPNKWSVGNIKDELRAHKIDFSGCTDKEQLLDLLHRIPQYKAMAIEHQDSYANIVAHKDEQLHYY